MKQLGRVFHNLQGTVIGLMKAWKTEQAARSKMILPFNQTDLHRR